jgi:hypothetical protein
MKSFFAILCLCVFAHSQRIITPTPSLVGLQKFRFYSPTAQEMVLAFNFTVELATTVKPRDTEILTAIDKQVSFLFGAFSSQYRTGVPKAEHEIKVLKVYNHQNQWRADYTYKGIVLLSQGPNTHSFYLPLNPYTVWTKATTSPYNRYACGDAHYPYEKYFWYFFNPKGYGCPLVEGQDIFLVQGVLAPQPNTQQTSPEYDRLFSNGELTFHVLFGMDNASLDWNPNSSQDISAHNYRQLKQVLTKWGYQSKVWTAAEITTFFGRLYGPAPSVEEFAKRTPKGIVRYRFFFGASTIPDGYAFHQFLSYSMMNSSVMVYAGHSGLGEYLNLDLITGAAMGNKPLKIAANTQRYQIYFFNSCSSYPYYNSQYFKLKKTAQDPRGTRNLDIIANGLSTLFSAITPSTLSLMHAVELYAGNGTKTTYQDIINKGNSDNLISIIGDEDNIK